MSTNFDGLHGWVVGDGGAILATLDGGKIWKAQTSGTAADLSSVAFLPDKVTGWAVGRVGRLLRTQDGGDQWESRNIALDVDLECIHAHEDGQRVWVVGSSGKVFRSTDGGTTWDPQELGDGSGLSSVFFLNDGKRGWIASINAIFSTDDGGVTWVQQTRRENSFLNSIWFLTDGLHGWAVGRRGRILATSDGGRTWNPQVSATTSGLHTVRASADEEAIWVAGSMGTLLLTRNGGRQWTSVATGTRSDFNGLSFNSRRQHGLAVGSGGTIIATDDDGVTWTQRTGTSGALLRAVAISGGGQSIWAVGEEGIVLISRDAGQTWKIGQTGTRVRLQGLKVLSDGRRAWAVGDAGLVLVTGDGGEHWEQQQSGTTGILSSVDFHDGGQVGIAVGFDGTIITTRDGGQNWTLQDSGVHSNFRSVHLHDDGARGWAVGDEAILTTPDGGQSWNLQYESVNHLWDIQFLANGRTGWAVGDSGTITSTQDGGRTWRLHPSDTLASLNVVHFHTDGLHGWVTGAAGLILLTNDGGQTWKLSNSRVGSTRLALVMDAQAKTGWAIGYPPALLNTIDGGQTWTPKPWPLSYERHLAPWYLAALALAFGALCIALRPERVAVHSGAEAIGATDAPTDNFARDRLQFGPLARGISRFLRNARTDPPLTLAISGDWGSGKSSLMALVCADLRRYGCRPIWFNAWHHQHEEQLLASLLCAIRDRGLPSMLSLDGWIFRLRLLWIRSRKHFVIAMVALTGLSALAAYLMWHEPEEWTRLWQVLQSAADGRTDALAGADVGRLAGQLFMGIAAMVALARSLKAFGADPAVLLSAAAANFRLRDASAQASFRTRFAEQFDEVTQALPYRMAIVIDDLDRCRPEAVQNVMETVNFLVSSGRCFVIFGMATHRVQAALALSFERIAEELVELDVQLPADATSEQKERAKRERRCAYARDYLEKLVNLEIPVPQRRDLPLHRLLDEESLDETGRALVIARQVLALWPLWLGASAIIAGMTFGKALRLPDNPQTPIEQAAAPAASKASDAVLVSAGIPTRRANNDSERIRPSYLPAVQEGDDERSFSHLSLVLALVALTIATVSLVLYRARTGMRQVTDSTAFTEALRIWLPVVQCRRGTPRAIKRFGNRLRYLAMLQQAEHLDRSLFDEVKNRLTRKSAYQTQEPRAGRCKGVEEHRLVALSALHDAYGATWRAQLEPHQSCAIDISNAPTGVDAAVREAISAYTSASGAIWPPMEEELDAFERSLKGVRVTGDVDLLPTAPSYGRAHEST